MTIFLSEWITNILLFKRGKLIRKINKQAIERERIFTVHISDQKLVSQ